MPTHAIQFAETINHFNSLIFSRVTYEELIVMNYSKKENKPLVPNIQNMTDRFNWIGDCIKYCFDECPKNDKIEFVNGLIMFVEKIRELNDIHFLVAISYTLARIEPEIVKSKKYSDDVINFFHEIIELCSFHQNYKKLRNYMNDLEPPYIPFIGVLSKDLMMLDEAQPNKVENGNINWYKWKKVYEYLSSVLNARKMNNTLQNMNEEMFIQIQQLYCFK